MLKQFIIFGFCGLLGEVVFGALKNLLLNRSYELRGEVSIWMFPIYGLIAFIFPLIAFRIGGFPWFVRGIIYMLAFFVVEYVCGLVLSKLRISIWNYPAKYSINGLVYLPYAPIWFLAGLGVERIYPIIVSISRGI